MKTTIPREPLLTALQQTVAVVEKKTTLEILGNVLIQMGGGAMTLTATDLETQVKVTVAHPVDLEKQTTLPARRLYDLLRLIPVGADIELDFSAADKAVLRSGRSKYDIKSLPAENYPEYPSPADGADCTCQAADLAGAIDRIGFNMAQADVRHFLNGMLFASKQNALQLVASDGHRLGQTELEVGGFNGEAINAIVPRKAVLELSRLLAAAGDVEIALTIGKSNIRAKIGATEFAAKLIDARYPDFSKVFAHRSSAAVVTQAKPLKDALARLAIGINVSQRVELDTEGQRMTLKAKADDGGEAAEEIAADTTGDPVGVVLMRGYLFEAVSHVGAENVALTIAENASVVRVEAPGRENYRFIVMPMR